MSQISTLCAVSTHLESSLEARGAEVGLVISLIGETGLPLFLASFSSRSNSISSFFSFCPLSSCNGNVSLDELSLRKGLLLLLEAGSNVVTSLWGWGCRWAVSILLLFSIVESWLQLCDVGALLSLFLNSCKNKQVCTYKFYFVKITNLVIFFFVKSKHYASH